MITQQREIQQKNLPVNTSSPRQIQQSKKQASTSKSPKLNNTNFPSLRDGNAMSISVTRQRMENIINPPLDHYNLACLECKRPK